VKAFIKKKKDVLPASRDGGHLENPESGHHGGRRNRVLRFFNSKSHFQLMFYSKHLENTLETLLNQSMATKNPTNLPKT
jgi:hypothetical protein